jgi:hypothetical protein
LEAAQHRHQFFNQAAADGNILRQQRVLVKLVNTLPHQKVNRVGLKNFAGQQVGPIVIEAQAAQVASGPRSFF